MLSLDDRDGTIHPEQKAKIALETLSSWKMPRDGTLAVTTTRVITIPEAVQFFARQGNFLALGAPKIHSILESNETGFIAVKCSGETVALVSYQPAHVHGRARRVRSPPLGARCERNQTCLRAVRRWRLVAQTRPREFAHAPREQNGAAAGAQRRKLVWRLELESDEGTVPLYSGFVRH